MTTHPLKQVIEAADQAISAGDFDALMGFYSDDATLVVKPGLIVTGKDNIRRAFVAIADYFNHNIAVRQGKMVVLEGGDTALVIMETILDVVGQDDAPMSITRRATYVFKQEDAGRWLCVIDNSYGTELLTANG